MKRIYLLLAFLLLLTGCGTEGGMPNIETQENHLVRLDIYAVYYVVTDTYSANYSYNRMTVIDTYADSIFARDLVADHISGGGFLY